MDGLCFSMLINYKEYLLVGDQNKSLAYLFKFNHGLNSTLNFDHNKKKEQYFNCRSEKYKDIITEEKVKREAVKRTNKDGSEDEME